MVDFAHERILDFMRSAHIKAGKVRINVGEVLADVPKCRWFDSSIPHQETAKERICEWI